MKITREELGLFSKFVEENGLEEKFEEFAECEVYSNSIYLSSSSHSYLSWDNEADYEVLIKVIKAINAMFDLELELV